MAETTIGKKRHRNFRAPNATPARFKEKEIDINLNRLETQSYIFKIVSFFYAFFDRNKKNFIITFT